MFIFGLSNEIFYEYYYSIFNKFNFLNKYLNIVLLLKFKMIIFKKLYVFLWGKI